MEPTSAQEADRPTAERSAALEVVDGRTGQAYRLPITDGAIRAADIAAIRTRDPDAAGLLSYDPAFLNTASCRSAITFIDGDRGILRYRGYPIEQLAERQSFLDVAWLLLHGELPSGAESESWASAVAAADTVPPAVADLVATFPPSAHPMTVLLAAWAALAAYRWDPGWTGDPARSDGELSAFVGLAASLVALVFRHRTGAPLRIPRPAGDFPARLLGGMFPGAATIGPAQRRAIDVLLILQADHEQNCSTSAVRAVGSSRVDPYSALAAGIAALYGPLHGGANEAVTRMLHEIDAVANVAGYIDSVKRGERRLMGFGHRVYKSYDPRARIIRATAEAVFAETGRNRLLDVAMEVERIALADAYFLERKLYPNVDFYSGLIYEAMGLPVDTYTTMFAVARMAGWVAQWREMIADPEQKIARPRQIYTGPGPRDVPPPRRVTVR